MSDGFRGSSRFLNVLKGKQTNPQLHITKVWSESQKLNPVLQCFKVSMAKYIGCDQGANKKELGKIDCVFHFSTQQQDFPCLPVDMRSIGNQFRGFTDRAEFTRID